MNAHCTFYPVFSLGNHLIFLNSLIPHQKNRSHNIHSSSTYSVELQRWQSLYELFEDYQSCTFLSDVIVLTSVLLETILISYWALIIFQALSLSLPHVPNSPIKYSILNITIFISRGGKWSLKPLGMQRKNTLPWTEGQKFSRFHHQAPLFSVNTLPWPSLPSSPTERSLAWIWGRV